MHRASQRLNEPTPLLLPLSLIVAVAMTLRAMSRLGDFSPCNFALIDSICFHLLDIDLFVLFCLINH